VVPDGAGARGSMFGGLARGGAPLGRAGAWALRADALGAAGGTAARPGPHLQPVGAVEPDRKRRAAAGLQQLARLCTRADARHGRRQQRAPVVFNGLGVGGAAARAEVRQGARPGGPTGRGAAAASAGRCGLPATAAAASARPAPRPRPAPLPRRPAPHLLRHRRQQVERAPLGLAGVYEQPAPAPLRPGRGGVRLVRRRGRKERRGRCGRLGRRRRAAAAAARATARKRRLRSRGRARQGALPQPPAGAREGDERFHVA
jgi:hypothetical protein